MNGVDEVGVKVCKNSIIMSLLQNEQNRNFVISTKGRNLNKYIAI